MSMKTSGNKTHANRKSKRIRPSTKVVKRRREELLNLLRSGGAFATHLEPTVDPRVEHELGDFSLEQILRLFPTRIGMLKIARTTIEEIFAEAGIAILEEDIRPVDALDGMLLIHWGMTATELDRFRDRLSQAIAN